LTNNGETVQVSDSSYMLWKIDELISYVSQFFTENRDIILREHLQVAAVNRTTYWRDFRGTKLFRIQVK
jgi:hypothetical protein